MAIPAENESQRFSWNELWDVFERDLVELNAVKKGPKGHRV